MVGDADQHFIDDVIPTVAALDAALSDDRAVGHAEKHGMPRYELSSQSRIHTKKSPTAGGITRDLASNAQTLPQLACNPSVPSYPLIASTAHRVVRHTIQV